MVTNRKKDLFDRIWLHVDNIFDLFLAQIQSKLLENFDVERVPVVGLLTYRVRLAIIVHVDELGQVMLDDLGEKHAIAEVARNVSFGPTEGDLVHPVVDNL